MFSRPYIHKQAAMVRTETVHATGLLRLQASQLGPSQYPAAFPELAKVCKGAIDQHVGPTLDGFLWIDRVLAKSEKL
jgi:hypothetical protein